MLQDLDVVALTADHPEMGLVRGNVGTIVHVHSATNFEVEFVDDRGRTYGLVTLPADHLLRLQFDTSAA